MLAIVTIELKTIGIRRYRHVLRGSLSGKRTRGCALDAGRLALARFVARQVQRFGSHGLGSGCCLPVSIAVWRLLRFHGIECDLRIGVRRGEGQFEAHAWVEHGGIVLTDTQDVATRFTPLASAQEAISCLPFESTK